jgi:hypothetical protein
MTSCYSHISNFDLNKIRLFWPWSRVLGLCLCYHDKLNKPSRVTYLKLSIITLTYHTYMLYTRSSFVTFYLFSCEIRFDLCAANSLGEFIAHSKYSMHSFPSLHLWIMSKNISLFLEMVF